MDWETAFNDGAAGFITADATLFAIQAISATAMLTWMCWVTLLAYTNFGAGRTTPSGMLFTVGRALLTTMVVLYLLTR